MLTVIKIKSFAPGERVYRVADGRGLNIEAKPNGIKIWRYRFRHSGKQNMATIGTYPERSLSEARDERYRLANLVKSGINPNRYTSDIKPSEPEAAPSFADVYQLWYGIKK